MGRQTDQPRIYIVSVRVSQEERENLEEIGRQLNKNVSELMRDALYARVLGATAA